MAAAGSAEVEEIRAKVGHSSYHGPGGIAYVDAENQHLWKKVRIGRIRGDGQFDIIWSSEIPIRPEPYPALRTRDATCGTIRLKLLKIGALVRRSVRRIKFAMASGFPGRPSSHSPTSICNGLPAIAEPGRPRRFKRRRRATFPHARGMGGLPERALRRLGRTVDQPGPGRAGLSS